VPSRTMHKNNTQKNFTAVIVTSVISEINLEHSIPHSPSWLHVYG